ALVTGNVVVHKPSERCPFLGLRLGEVWSSVLPEGVLSTLTGDKRTGAALAADPSIDMIAHVGSTAAGHSIRAAAAARGAHVICENGGNDALIVASDVDPRWAAEQAALGAFANAGQICTSVERIIVHREIANGFTEELVRAAAGYDEQRMPPLVDGDLRTRVHGQVERAADGGATVLIGGVVPPGPGTRYPATVLTGCEPQMD